jgi:myosin heavy subunit
MILHSNPLLEAFGNAKTLRNNNSSRFGKWIQVTFNSQAHISGAKIINYLLEKSRVVQQAVGERNYHIFYQILSGLNDEERGRIHLHPDPRAYYYLKSSHCYMIDGVNDSEQFIETFHAMKMLQFPPQIISSLLKVLASVLLLGNLTLSSTRIQNADGSKIDNLDVLHCIAANLGFDADSLTKALTFRSVTIRGETSMIPLTPVDATVARDSFAKALYGKLFDYLIRRLNSTLYRSESSQSQQYIGILDIFGFEIFEKNSLEQLMM